MNFEAKRDERRWRAMREVLAAVCRLRDRLMELSAKAVWGWGLPTENVWSERRLREAIHHLWEVRRRMLDDAPAGGRGGDSVLTGVGCTNEQTQQPGSFGELRTSKRRQGGTVAAMADTASGACGRLEYRD